MDRTHANEDECLLLITVKRRYAKDALQRILTGFGFNRTFPKITTVLDYLTNMTSCLELMLKFLSGDWRSHNVKAMYETAFGTPHPNPTLMDDIAAAVRDQKYLLQPNGGLLAEVPALEELFVDLRRKMLAAKDRYSVNLTLEAPASFVTFLRDQAPLYYTKEGPTVVHFGPPIRNAEGTDGPDMSELADALQEGYERDIERIQETFDCIIRNNQKFIIHQGEIMMF